MNRQYVINANNFTGVVQTSLTNGHPDFSNFDLATYMQRLRNDHPEADWQIVDSDELETLITEAHHRLYLGKPAVKISKDDFYYALECLPPEHWVRTGGIEHFRMMEYYTGSITTQYAYRHGKYIKKMIDVTDKSTWITIEDFETAVEEEP